MPAVIMLHFITVNCGRGGLAEGLVLPDRNRPCEGSRWTQQGVHSMFMSISRQVMTRWNGSVVSTNDPWWGSMIHRLMDMRAQTRWDAA